MHCMLMCAWLDGWPTIHWYTVRVDAFYVVISANDQYKLVVLSRYNNFTCQILPCLSVNFDKKSERWVLLLFTFWILVLLSPTWFNVDQVWSCSSTEAILDQFCTLLWSCTLLLNIGDLIIQSWEFTVNIKWQLWNL